VDLWVGVMVNFLKMLVVTIFVFSAQNSFAQKDVIDRSLLEPFEVSGVEVYTSDVVEEKMDEAIKNNDPFMQYTIGYMYQNGFGLPTSVKEASNWYKLASDNGHVGAMVSLGIIYKFGNEELPANAHRALTMLRKAARADDARAHYEIGEIYEFGLTGYVKVKKAMEHYKEAARLGDLNAHFRLATYCSYGYLVDYNMKKAIKHYNYVYDNTKYDDIKLGIKTTIGEIYYSIAVSLNDPSARIKWFEIAAEFDHLPSVEFVASAYKDGKGIPQDFDRAVFMYKRAADMGSTHAMNTLGYMYSNGIGVDKNINESLAWYRQSAEAGSSNAAWYIGKIYHDGIGVPKDREEAKKWFERQKRLQQIHGKR